MVRCAYVIMDEHHRVCADGIDKGKARNREYRI